MAPALRSSRVETRVPHLRRGFLLAVISGLALTALFVIGRPYVRGFSFIVRATDQHGWMRAVATVDSVSVTEQPLLIPSNDLWLRGRAYVPAGRPRQTVLLVPGLHPGGIDEPRLVAFARGLAGARILVVTPDIPELRHFEITPLLTERIERAAFWLSSSPALAPAGRIGLMGISFSGGLAIVAAGRPSLQHRLLYVFSFGGHDDLRRVLQYFCGEREPHPSGLGPPSDADEGTPGAHDYGLAVATLNVADALVPAEQAPALREGVRRYLWASYLTRSDPPAAEHEFAAARDLARGLPEPAASVLREVNARDVGRLGRRLGPYIEAYLRTTDLSPARSANPTAPLYLLHGREDTVIPVTEPQHLADRLRGQLPVHLLITDLISHAAADQPPHFVAELALIAFWSDLLSQ